MRKFIIGDIHGCFEELMELLEKMNVTVDDLLISVGDIVDRGNKSKEVFEFFVNRPNSIVLMGNHERKHQNKLLTYAQEIVKIQFGENDYQKFLDWTTTLPYFYELEEAIIIHAGFEHDKSLQEQREDVLCGSTAGERYLETKYYEKYWTDFYAGTKPIIFGHHVVGNDPKIFNNTFGIDTGACHNGYLTAVELPNFVIHQVKSKKDYWKEEQTKWQIPVLKAKNWGEMTFEEIEKFCQKLAYIEDNEIKEYLAEIQRWKKHLLAEYPIIKSQIEVLTQQIFEKYPENFNQEASKFFCNTFIFKAKKQVLQLKDLEKTLITPNKILEFQNNFRNILV